MHQFANLEIQLSKPGHLLPHQVFTKLTNCLIWASPSLIIEPTWDSALPLPPKHIATQMPNSDSADKLRLTCPKCTKSILVPNSMRGRSGKCPSCGTAIKIPLPKPIKEEPNPFAQEPDLLVPVRQTPVQSQPQPPTIVQSSPVAPHSTNVYTPVGQPAAVQVNVHNSNVSNSLGIASLILGILSLLICWIPFIGFGLSGLGFLLGIAGLIMAIARKGTGIGFAIAGSAVSGLGILMGIIFIVALQGMATGLENVANQMEAELNKPQTQAAPFDPAAPDNTSPTDESNSSLTGDAPKQPGVVFHDANTPLQLGNIKIQITIVQIGKVPLTSLFGDDSASEDDLLTVWMEITNTTSNKKIDYQGWMSSYASLMDIDAELTDNNDNRYRSISFSSSSTVKGAKTNESIYPGKSIVDAVVFELPIDGVEYLNLKLSAKGCKEDGEFRFKIPATMIKR